MLTQAEIFEHYCEQIRPRPRVRGVLDRELERYRRGLLTARCHNAILRLTDRVRRLAAPRWNPGRLPPTARSLDRRVNP